MMSEGDAGPSADIIKESGAYLSVLSETRDFVSPIGLTVLSVYMPKVPTMWVEHMDCLVRARVQASEVAQDPCEEFADGLLSLHQTKVAVMSMKLEKTVFRLNSAFMRQIGQSVEQALPVFMGAVASGLSAKEAMGHVANRFNLPVEML
jgi:hypothetical protein